MNFKYSSLSWNIKFGSGSLDSLSNELDILGKKKPLILTTPEQSEIGQKVLVMLQKKCIGIFDQAKMHVPIETLNQAKEIALSLEADCTVSIGGGSTIGLGKALAVKYGIDNIVIPTSYSGSEMTNIWAITKGNRKTTSRSSDAVPNLTIYDPELTLTMPIEFTAASAMNALAQAVVNVATVKPNPIVSSMAIQAISSIAEGLPVVVKNPKSIDARAKLLYGSSMAGASLGTGTTGLHHRLCHTFGGSFNTPHAQTHSILLSHSVAFNSSATEEGTRQVAKAMNVANAADGIFSLLNSLKIPHSLKEIGIKESDLDKAVDISLEVPVDNPEPVNKAKLRRLLQNAYLGLSPEKL